MREGPNTLAIVARGVGKSLGEHRVLDRVDLTIAEGTTFSLLGPHGAGKTTMVRILSTLVAADGGGIQVTARPGRPTPSRARHGTPTGERAQSRSGTATKFGDVLPARS
jgi:ABC-type multidrug transport system ATPase subunit